MTEKKKINFERLMSAAELASKRPKKVIWHTIDITIKYSISLDEYLSLTTAIINSCTDGDGNCALAFIDFATRANIVQAYTNLSLPDNLSALYQVLYSTDLYETVYKNANMAQIDSIVDLVKSLIKTGESYG